MNSRSDFQQWAVDISGTDRDLWLGRLAWISVSELSVSHTDLVAAMHRHRLTAYLPPLPEDGDIFKRVCRKAERKRVNKSDTGYENYLIRDAGYDDRRVYRRLVRETVAAGGALLYETQLCTIDFIKASSTLDVSCTSNAGVMAQTIADEIRHNYEVSRGTMHSDKVRALIRGIIESCHGINVRGKGGGLYFIPQQSDDVIDRLEALAAELPGEAVDIHSFPLIDNDHQRNMLHRAFESEAIHDIDELIEEIEALRAGQAKVGQKRLDRYVDAYNAFEARAQAYKDLLEDNLSGATGSLQVYQRLVMDLMAMTAE